MLIETNMLQMYTGGFFKFVTENEISGGQIKSVKVEDEILDVTYLENNSEEYSTYRISLGVFDKINTFSLGTNSNNNIYFHSHLVKEVVLILEPK